MKSINKEKLFAFLEREILELHEIIDQEMMTANSKKSIQIIKRNSIIRQYIEKLKYSLNAKIFEEE